MTAHTLRLELFLSRVRGSWWVLMLAATAVLLLWAWALPKERLAVEAAAKQAARAAAMTGASTSPLPLQDAGSTALTAFEDRLADGDDQARLMRVLWRYAQAAGVQLSKVDYRREDVLQARYRRLTLTVPMTGSYPMIRQVVFQLMSEFPGLALIRLDMKRESSSQIQVDATAHLVLYLRP